MAAYLCATAGLTVLVGATGQLSLGHAALMAVGGYGFALTRNALPFDDRAIVVGGVPLLSPYDLFVLVVAVVVMGALAVLFRWTSLGLQMRAAAFAPEVSRLLGVRVSRTVTVGWVLSSVVGSLAALLLVPTSLGLNPHATDSLFVLGFTVAVVGGLDSPVGALVGGVVVGVAMSLVTGYLGAGLVPIAVLVLLVLVLLLRPAGLFAAAEARRA